MAARLVQARRRAQERDVLATLDAGRERRDELVLRFHFREVALLVFAPADGRAVLSPVRGVELAARAEVLHPFVPRLELLPEAARTIATDEHADSVARLLR